MLLFFFLIFLFNFIFFLGKKDELMIKFEKRKNREKNDFFGKNSQLLSNQYSFSKTPLSTPPSNNFLSIHSPVSNSYSPPTTFSSNEIKISTPQIMCSENPGFSHSSIKVHSQSRKKYAIAEFNPSYNNNNSLAPYSNPSSASSILPSKTQKITLTNSAFSVQPSYSSFNNIIVQSPTSFKNSVPSYSFSTYKSPISSGILAIPINEHYIGIFVYLLTFLFFIILFV
jgi:hypothetical protein